MTVKALLKGRVDCACGTPHVYPICEAVIEEDALSKIRALTAVFSHVIYHKEECLYLKLFNSAASSGGLFSLYNRKNGHCDGSTHFSL